MILITGASGFIGKHLLLKLVEKFGEGNIVALTSNPIEGVNCLLHNNFIFEPEYFILNGYENVEIIIHGGAFTPKKKGDENNILSCNSNIYTTQKLLESRFPNLKKVIYLSTLDVYGADELTTEQSAISPISLYGFSKLYSEKIVEIWSEKNGVDFQILRIGHVYGPGEEKYQKIIPVCVSRVLKNESIQLNGSGHAIRSFIYINDVTSAILNSIKCKNGVGVINIVGGVPISIIDLITLISSISKIKPILEYLPVNLKERNIIFDNSKMLQYLDVIETPLHEGLIEEYNYMKNILK